MKNFENCKYTYAHKKVIEFMVQKYIKDEDVRKEMMKRAKLHDMDKLTTYLFWNKDICSNVHRDLMPHHVNSINKEKTKYDYIEMVLDWESARYTKPDKPLNAYDTLYTYYPQTEKYILPILKELELDKSGVWCDEAVARFASEIMESITEEDIVDEVIEYVKEVTKSN